MSKGLRKQLINQSTNGKPYELGRKFIKGILEGQFISFTKEILQNADDAKAKAYFGNKPTLRT